MEDKNDSALYRESKTNYHLMLGGIFIFPVWLYVFLNAKRKVNETSGYLQSHYRYQMITSKYVMIFLIALAILTAIVFYHFLPNSPGEPYRSRGVLGSFSSLFYLPIVWLVVRIYRGLQLAKMGEGIAKPSSLWFWPQSAGSKSA